MTEREVRMRSIEAIATMGIREPSRLVQDADALAKWVMAGEDKAQAPSRAPKKIDGQA